LCLLCATLAWRSVLAAQSQLQAASSAGYAQYVGEQPLPVAPVTRLHTLGSGRRPPLIIYASRTHSQLSQVISELRKTSYRPKLAVVGSREQLCTNPAVKKLQSNSAMTTVCGQLVKRNSCEMHGRVHDATKRLEMARAGGDLLDIEDIVKLGNMHR
jgi:regulator of telomere elongation helicase 1